VFVFVVFLHLSVGLLNFVSEAQQQGNITRSIATLSQARYQLAATPSQNLVFFGGGSNSYSETPTIVYDRVDIYNTLNGSWSTATLSQARFDLAATSVGNLVLFGGGVNSNVHSNVVDVFNVTSNTWTTATLSQARSALAATSITASCKNVVRFEL
jgi:hypothetical protein